MTRSAAARAEQAAEALDTFLRARKLPEAGSSSADAAPEASFEATRTDNRATGTPASAGSGRAPARRAFPSCARSTGEGAPLRLPHPDWLHHRLAVTGPAEALDAFRTAAAGAGTIPWHLDADQLEEDWFHRLIDPAHRTLSLKGARVLASQLREAVERRHALAVARVGRSRACLFDLHALVPVPPDILLLGPDHPHALAWLWRRWGTTEALRHVAAAGGEEDGRAAAGMGAFRLTFWSVDWSPWRALARIRTDWPALRFDLQPDYDSP